MSTSATMSGDAASFQIISANLVNNHFDNTRRRSESAYIRQVNFLQLLYRA